MYEIFWKNVISNVFNAATTLLWHKSLCSVSIKQIHTNNACIRDKGEDDVSSSRFCCCFVFCLAFMKCPFYLHCNTAILPVTILMGHCFCCNCNCSTNYNTLPPPPYSLSSSCSFVVIIISSFSCILLLCYFTLSL